MTVENPDLDQAIAEFVVAVNESPWCLSAHVEKHSPVWSCGYHQRVRLVTTGGAKLWMEFRLPEGGMVIVHVFGNYDFRANKWVKMTFVQPTAEDLIEAGETWVQAYAGW